MLNETIFIRRDKDDGYWTGISNLIIKDKRLSNSAIGLMTKILSNKDTWKISLKWLIKESRDGETAIRRQLTELEQCGYIRKTHLRNKDGTYGAWQYIVSEYGDLLNNVSKDIVKSSTYCGKSNVGESSTNNININNTNINNNISTLNNLNSLPTKLEVEKEEVILQTTSSQINEEVKDYENVPSQINFDNSYKQKESYSSSQIKIKKDIPFPEDDSHLEKDNSHTKTKSLSSVAKATGKSQKFPNEWYSKCLNTYFKNYEEVNHYPFPNVNAMYNKFKGVIKQQFLQGFTPEDLCKVFENGKSDNFIVQKTGYKLFAMLSASSMPNLLTGFKPSTSSSPFYSTKGRSGIELSGGIEKQDYTLKENLW